MAARRFFSDSYGEARHRILTAAEQAGGLIRNHENRAASGPGGERLWLDTLWFGPPAASRVLLDASGTHGAEGFVGSAVQLAWIEDGGPKNLPPDVAVLMIHAVNPFGFAHCLRGTEDNVDINRNWIDHTAAAPDNPLYAELHEALCVASLDNDTLAEAAEAVTRVAITHDQWTIDDALSRGQYRFPDGYYYGGSAPAWPQRMVAAIFASRLARVRHIAMIDWHSGPIGDGEVIYLCYDDRASDAYHRAASWWGRENLADREVDRLWGGRRPGRHGVMVTGLSRLLRPHATMAGGVIELCSAPAPSGPAGAFRIPMIERWLRFVGGLECAEAGRYRDEIRENYAPRRAAWQDRVIEAGLDIHAATIDGLAHWGKE